MKITLTGMPGCGKSFTGKILSDTLKLPYFDTDQLIVHQEHISIKEIFRKHGELYFRRLERKLLEELLKKDVFVLSVGGGLPCHFENMKRIKEYSLSFYLKADIELLINRLSNDRKSEDRPLISTDSEAQAVHYLKKTIKERETFYLQADHIVQAESASDEILKLIKLHC